jgi:hypothetical protein
MNKLCSTFVALWNKTESLLPLVLLMLISLVLALLLGVGNEVLGASSLFQSPPPPTREEPTVPPPPPPEPTATPVPTETPVPPSEPIATPLPPEATAAAPTETPETSSEGSPPAPAETPPPAEAEEAPEAAEPAPATPDEPEVEEEPPPSGSPPLVFNWGVFLNTVVVTLSYAWICLGVCGLVGAPLVFILLYVGGKRRLSQRVEGSEETEQNPEADATG